MKKLIAAAMVSVALLVVGCSGGGYGTVGPANLTMLNGNPGGTAPVTQPSSNTALFHPAAGVLPYPTDLYFAGSTDGTLNIQPANALMPNQAAINALDGFSTTAVIRERFGGALNPASFTAASVIIVPVSTDNLTKATTGVLGPPLTPGPGHDYTAALATDAGVGPTILEITPQHPLVPSTCISGSMFLGPNCTTGTGYLVILTNGITDISGNPAVPDTDYANIKAALASGGAKCPSITDPTLNAICQLTGAHLQIAQAIGLNPTKIVLTFSFTTESTTDTLELLSATTKPQAITVQHPPGFTTAAIPGLGLPGHADLYVGVLTIPYYLSATAPLTEYWHAPPFPLDMTSTFTTRFNPLPVASTTLKVPVLVSVPNTASTVGATPPASGWPVVIFQHGITRNREDMFGLADSFADNGFVVVAIDLPLHGITSTSDPLYAGNGNPLYTGLGVPAKGSIERTFDLDVENNTTGAAGPDGVIDPSGSHFIVLTSLLTSRDNLREGAADLITLARSLANTKTLLGAAGNIDPTKIHYVGHSLGAIEGSMFLAVATPTDVGTGTLAMPGGGLTLLLQDSPAFSPQINAGLAAQGLTPGMTLYAQFFRDAQTAIDAGDPINYIALATVQHPIHLIQVVGGGPLAGGGTSLPDQVVPNSATQRLITASAYAPAGLTAAPLTRIPAPALPGPVVNAGGFRAYVNFLEGNHGSIIDPTASLPTTQEMQGEAISFAASGGTAIVINVPAVIQP